MGRVATPSLAWAAKAVTLLSVLLPTHTRAGASSAASASDHPEKRVYKRLGLLPAVHHGVLAILMFASLLVVCTDALPASWALLRGMPAGSREALFSRVLELPLADVDRLVVDHTQYLGLHMRNTKYMAAEGFSGVDALSEGSWMTLEDGSQLWTWTLMSADAPSHMLLFETVQLPWGSELVIFSRKAVAEFSVCEDSCMHVTARSMPAGERLTTPPIAGDTVTLLYYQPAALGDESGANLQLYSVMQDVRHRLAEAVQARRRRSLLVDLTTQESNDVVGTHLPVHLMQQNTSAVAPCAPSIECYPQFAVPAAAVVSVYVPDVATKTVGLCSGSIVRGPVNNHYLLTADHCLRDKTKLEGFQYWLVIFNYDAPCTINSTDIPRIGDLVQGVRLSYYDSKADVLLMSLTTTIPDHFDAYLIGFDAAPSAVPTAAVGIHQPDGSYKSFSRAGSISTDFPAPNFPPDEVQPTSATHFQVTWSLGATVGGSSGSPLIDNSTNKVVGVLTGGYSACYNGLPDYYGRLSAAWPAGLYLYLASSQDTAHGASKSTAFIDPNQLGVVKASNTLGGAAARKHGPSIGTYPSVIHFQPNVTTQKITYYLTDPPAANETVMANITLISLQGNAVDVTPYVYGYNEGINFTFNNQNTFNFTQADYGTQFDVMVKTRGLDGVIPGGLLRFVILVNVTSDANPGIANVLFLKGLVQQSRPANWTSLPPIVVTKLPYFATYPIASPSGRAVWEVQANEAINTTDYVDIVVCRFPEPLKLQIPDGTVSAYRGATFIWTLTPYNDPFGNQNCVYAPSQGASANTTYFLVDSDSDDFNAVKNISAIKAVYIGYTNQSIATNIMTTS